MRIALAAALLALLTWSLVAAATSTSASNGSAHDYENTINKDLMPAFIP
jgi:hypothetical protein